MQNPFLLPVEAYQREIDPIGDWVRQTAWYASKMLGVDIEKAKQHLLSKLKNKEVQFNNPTVLMFHREENGDKFKKTTSLQSYINSIVGSGHILAPTGTSYLHPTVLRSKIVDYLDENVVMRKKLKKTAQKHEAEGNVILYNFYNTGQDNAKRDNNAVSGGFVAEGSVIKNKSAHSTLTSTTRSIASLSNASNERLIEGNRHYYSPDIIINNITSICSSSNYEHVAEALDLYRLKAPSVDETIACIQRSSDLYFRDTRKINEIRKLVEKLDDLERSAFVYTGDFYHLRVCNPEIIRQFITELSRKGDSTPVEDVISKLYKTDEMVVNYAHQVNITMLKGKGKDYEEKLTFEEQCILYNTCQNIINVIMKYQPLLKAFFLTKNTPPTMASVPTMIRRAVVLSDTDSTMFSVDSWVQWYFNKLDFSDEGFAVAGAVMYMATQSMSHILAHFSANMNVERTRLFSLAMKPEYVFPVFAQTSVAKHYYTAMLVKEGNVYKDIKMEIKGVHMKDSTVPKNIITAAASQMERVIRTVMAGNKLSLMEIVNEATIIENNIIESIKKGETTYLRRIQIKDKSSYKNEIEKYNDKGERIDVTNYRHYTCWQRCFAAKYGNAETPPFSAVTIPLKLTNASATNSWLNSLEDKEFASNFAEWMTDHKITSLTQLHIPIAFCQNHGVPPELIPILDVKRVVLALTRSFRNIVESHGLFPKSETMLTEQFYSLNNARPV